jgi:hypothetical protein
MRKWIVTLFLLAMGPAYGAWTCDQGRELASVRKDQMTGRDSRPFLHALNARYDQHVTPMRAFEAAHPDAKPGAYLETEMGKKTAFKLKDIQEGFNYDRASQYLLGEPIGERPSNPDRVDYTHIYQKGRKLFYLDGDRVAAVRLKVSDSEYMLKIFNNDCSLREIVSLPTLQLGSDTGSYDYKINSAYCSQYGSRQPKRVDADLQDEMKIYLPDEQQDVDQLKSRLVRDCQQWSAPLKGSSKARSNRDGSSTK